MIQDTTELLPHAEPMRRLFFLQLGAVELMLPHEEYGWVSMAVLRAPALLGVTDYLLGTKAAFSFRALGSGSGQWIDAALVDALLVHTPSLRETLIAQASLERRALAITAAGLHDGAEARLAGLLSRYAEAIGRPEGQKTRILARRPQHELGAVCGLTLRHTNRVLGKWKRQGIVEKDAGNLVIDVARLRADLSAEATRGGPWVQAQG